MGERIRRMTARDLERLLKNYGLRTGFSEGQPS